MRKLILTRLIIIYLILLSIIISLFGYLYNYFDNINNAKNYSECIYFSAITYLTIGYGEFYPINNIGRILTSLEGVMGIIVNAIFTGLIFFIFCKRQQTYILPKFICLKYKNNMKYLIVRIGNKGSDLFDIKIDLEFFRYEDDRRIKITSLCSTKEYIEKTVYFSFNINDIEKDLIKYLKNGLKNKDNSVQIKLNIRSVAPYTGEIIYDSKMYNLDNFRYIREYEKIYKWDDNKRGKTNWRKFDDFYPLDEELIKTYFDDIV